MKSLLFYLSAGIFLLLCTVAAECAADDTQSLLAHAKQAAGGEAVDHIRTTHTRLKIKLGGIEGAGEFWEDVRTGRFRSELQLGPASEAEGFDGTTSWSLDSAKQPLKSEGDDAVKGNADDAYRRTMAYWYPARWAGVIETLGQREEPAVSCVSNGTIGQLGAMGQRAEDDVAAGYLVDIGRRFDTNAAAEEEV